MGECEGSDVFVCACCCFPPGDCCFVYVFQFQELELCEADDNLCLRSPA